ncbi:MAG: zinc-ribbon domain-containing protein [Clostridiales bacterium]|nr:zinc-ribbon domain-containing protein [Clostridiales bacterium]
MAKCTKCGAELEEGAKFCPSCGEKQGEQTSDSTAASSSKKNTSFSTADVSAAFNKFNDTEDSTNDFDESDINSNKVMGILAYLSWLVIIPLIAAPHSKFARFHVNQGLVLAIFEIVWGVVLGVISTILHIVLGLIFLGWLARIITSILGLVSLAFLVMSIIGIVNVANGKAKRLPVIGNITIIK